MAFNEVRTERGIVSSYRRMETPEPVARSAYVWGGLRLMLGWVFAWAFVDKTFGLGFATTPEKAWIAGGSPTLGYLKFGSHGPFAGLFQAIAGHAVTDALFMLGLVAVGVSLLLGIGVRVAAVSGSVMLALMYLAALPPENNPVVDDHIVYIVALVGVAVTRAGRVLGFGRRWERLAVVRRHGWLV